MADRSLLSSVAQGHPMLGTFTSVLTRSMLYGVLKRIPSHSQEASKNKKNVISVGF
jgi:hypothetical protein